MRGPAFPGKIRMNPKAQASLDFDPRRPGLWPVPLFFFVLLCLCACSGQKSKKDKTFSRVALARYSPGESAAGSALKKGFSLKFGPKLDLSNSWLCLASPACSCSFEGRGLVLSSPKPEMGFEFESPLVGDFTLEVSYAVSYTHLRAHET